MRNFLRYLFVSLLLLSGGAVAHATHIVGGNLSYKCAGNNIFELSLTVRRDCEFGQEPFDKDLHLTIYNGKGGFLVQLGQNGYVKMKFLGVWPVDSDLESDCIDQGSPVCVEEARYTGRVYLPPGEASGYILSYQRCCRNWTLNNIVDPLLTGTTYFVHILPQSISVCNSSPVFKDWAPIYICSGLPLRFDHAAADADGDSLVYELCAPFQGLSFSKPQALKADPPPYEPVVWKAPYNLDNLLGGVPLKIDPNTGLLTATPSTVGQYLVGVCVKEYRGGNLIGVHYRDFEFNVRPCGEKPTADFERNSDPCDGLTQSFKSTSNKAKSFQWFFDSENDRTKSSTVENPVFTYDSAGTYRVLLKVERDGCTDSIAKNIEILNPDIKVDFDYDLLCEDSVILQLESKASANDSLVSWKWSVRDPSGSYSAKGANATIKLSKGVHVTISLEVEDIHGCKGNLTKTVYLPNIDIEPVGDSLEICLGDSIALLNYGRKHYHYSWSPIQGLNLKDPSNPIASPRSSTTYFLTVTNDTCSLRDSIYLRVKDTIPVFITGTDTTCDGTVVLAAHSTKTAMFEWSYTPHFDKIIGSGDTLHLGIDRDTIIYVRAGAEDDCRGEASWKIIYGGRNVHIPREHIVCFGGGEVYLNPGGDSSLNYVWHPGKYLDDSTGFNPLAKVDHTVRFYVIVVDSSFPKCDIMDSTLVRVGPKFSIMNLPPDTVLCDEDTLRLDVKIHPPGAEISWCDNAGNVIGTENPFVFVPQDSAGYVLKIKDSLGCVTRDTIFVRSYHPDFDIIYPPDVCIGDSALLKVINHGGPIRVIWKLSEQLQIIDDSVIIRPTMDAHSCRVMIMYGDGCMYQKEININVHGFAEGEVIATASPKRVVKGFPIQLDAKPAGYSYRWMPPEYLDDPNSNSPVATIDTPGKYLFKVKLTDDFDCMGMDTVTVTILPLDCEKGVFLPNAFSPNGDGVNDQLLVRGYVIKEMHLVIYNRWGEKLFETRNQAEGWDGWYKGSPLPPDVYNYRLSYTCLNDTSYVRTGNVSILLR